jgi:hypothetical protein
VIRSHRIARRLVATTRRPHVDFWAAILHAFPNRDIQFLGDAVEERSGDKFAENVLAMLDWRFGYWVDDLTNRDRYSIGDLERDVVQAMKQDDWGGFSGPGPLARSIRQILPNIVRRALEAKQSAVQLGTLAPGRFFHYINESNVYRVVEQHPDNEETWVEDRRPSEYPHLNRSEASDMVFPIDEELHA